MRSTLAFVLLATASSAASASPVLGPTYPPPGGVTYSSTGSLGSGTLVGTYSGFDLSATDQLWWGANSIQLAMDGAVDSAGETLVFNAGLSNLAAGFAVYTGSTRLFQNGNPTAVGTQYSVTLTDLLGNALAFNTTSAGLGLGGNSFPLYEVTGGFKATQTLSANGQAYQTYFNNAPFKSPTPGQLQSSVNRSFYYTENAVGGVPEPATWGLMLLGFGAIGGTLRRRQKVAARIRFV